MTSKVRKLQRASLNKPVKVEVDSKYTTVDNLVQNYVFLPLRYKETYLAYVLNEFSGNSAIVFCSTCHAATKVATLLRHLGFSAVSLNGQMSQSKRLGALRRFKTGERNILVATDVASRGLDIPSVDLVLNYDIPQNSKDYIHRVGRTARAGRGGRAITFVTQYDVELFQRIEALIGMKMDEFATEEETVLVLLERVTEASRLAAVDIRAEKEKRSKRGRKSGHAFQHGSSDGNKSGRKGTKKKRRR